MRIISINGKQYIAGLWWQVAKRSGRKQLMLAAQNTAASFTDTAYDHVVLRKRQYGLGDSHSLQTPRLPSLASLACACLKNSPPSWLGLFQLDGCFWVCAVHAGEIAGEGDFICDTLTAAHQHVTDLQALRKWDTVIICETQEDSLAHLVTVLKPAERIIPLHTPSRRIYYTLAIVCVLAVSIGGYAWRRQQQSAAQEQARLALLKIQEARKSEQIALLSNPGKQFPAPWENKAAAQAVVVEWVSLFRQQALYQKGWMLKSINYDGTSATVSWSHQPGASFASLPVGAVVSLKNPTECTATLILNAIPVSSASTLLSRDDAAGHFYELTRSLACKSTLKFLPPLKKTLSINGTPTPLVAPWVRGTWKLSKIPITAFNSHFFTALDCPGLVISRAIFAMDYATLEGELYAKN